jgi:hypothetical protein
MALTPLLDRNRLGPALFISKIFKKHKQKEKKDSQIPREINVEPVVHGQVITEQLQRDDIQQPLQAIYSLGNTNGLGVLRNAVIILVAHNDGLRFASCDLGKGGLHLGIERVASHNDDDWHVLIDQSEWAVFQFTSKDTLRSHVRQSDNHWVVKYRNFRTFRVHVTDFFDLESTLKHSSVSASQSSATSGI